MVVTQETTQKINDFNHTYNIGQVVAYQDNDRVKFTRLRSKAFIGGRYGAPYVKLELKKGNFSISKIKDPSQIENRKNKNVYKPKYQKVRDITGHGQLKRHIEQEIELKEFSIVNKNSILLLFPPIKRKWGVIDETKQFQIWLKSCNYKITCYSKNYYKVENMKK